jgi:signal transduction histidine kinase
LPGSEQTEGSGIGLPLALRLVEEMGGRVQIDSAPGAGTRFRIDLPAHPTASLSRGAR